MLKGASVVIMSNVGLVSSVVNSADLQQCDRNIKLQVL